MRKKFSKKNRWKDEEIMRWANHYIVLGTPIMKLEISLGVPHSTLWWCFTHRLQRIDESVYHEVLERINYNKTKGKGKYASISN